MGLGSRLIGYAVFGALVFNLSRCMTERKMVDASNTPQLYTIAGVAIEDVQEPLYCIGESEIVQYESVLELMVER